MEKDAFFQALDNPYRRGILRLLQTGEMSAGDIAAHFPISQPSISRHLDLLRRTGLIVSRRLGSQILYSLDPAAVQESAGWLGEFLPHNAFS